MKAGSLATINWIDIAFNTTINLANNEADPSTMTMVFANGYTTSLSFISPTPEKQNVVGVAAESTPSVSINTDGAQISLRVPVDMNFSVVYNSILAGQPLEGVTDYTLTGVAQHMDLVADGFYMVRVQSSTMLSANGPR